MLKDWILNQTYTSLETNITMLQKEGYYIFLEDLYSEEIHPTQLKISSQQFLQLIAEWQEKVCKDKPQEILIIHNNGHFSVETKK